MSQPDLEELEAALEKATPGPWKWELCPCGFDDDTNPVADATETHSDWGHHGPDLVSQTAKNKDGWQQQVLSSIGYDADNVIVTRADAELIVLAVNALPALIEALKRK